MKKTLLYLLIICICVIALTACEDENKPSASVTGNNTQLVENTIDSGEEKKEAASSGEKVEEVKEENIEEVKDEVKEDEKVEPESNNGYTIIKFSDMYETKGKVKNVSTVLKNLNGKKVEIKGYPAVQSPLDESFVYLNNQPYVTCPFCAIGDITKLEVIPILMADGSKIKYTENAIKVQGKLEVAPKLDSEGYTTQFRVYADKVEELQDSNANKAVNDYYSVLSKAGMIYDIQTLQMNVEYATNPEYMTYYDEKLQTGKSKVLDKVAVLKAIADEYLGFDDEYGTGFGSGYVYLDYIKECPDIVKTCEPTDERLIKLNNELVKLYTDEIVILEKYQNICYKIHALGDKLTEKEAEGFANELKALNAPNMKQYEIFTTWNNKLRE